MRIKTRIISALITVMLVLTYTPMVTFADSTASLVSNIIECLRDEDIDTAQEYNQQLPETATEECISNMTREMRIAYGNVVHSWEDVKQYGQYAFRDYWLTDIDNDGSAELLVNLVPDYASAQTHVYQYKNGKTVEIGSFSGNYTCHAYPDNNGIVAEGAKMGYNWFSLITIENGAIGEEQLVVYGDGKLSWDEYFDMRNQLKTHSEWNGNKYIPIYDELIESEPNGHTLEHFDQMPATTSSEGNIEYWYCSTCKKYFADDQGDIEITKADTVIPKLSDGTSQKAKMTTYGTIKKGNTVYCASTGGLYRVNLKTKKVKRLLKISGGSWIGLYSLAKKGDYLYYISGGPASSCLYRVKVSGGKKNCLFGSYMSGTNVNEYAIYNNKLYANYTKDDSYKVKHKVMKLNGESKKQTTIAAKQTEKKTNKKGYYTYCKFKKDYVYDYLKTPNGRIYLGKSGPIS